MPRARRQAFQATKKRAHRAPVASHEKRHTARPVPAKKKGTEQARCLVRDISSDVIVFEKVFVSSDPRFNQPGLVSSEWTVRVNGLACAPDLPHAMRHLSAPRCVG